MNFIVSFSIPVHAAKYTLDCFFSIDTSLCSVSRLVIHLFTNQVLIFIILINPSIKPLVSQDFLIRSNFLSLVGILNDVLVPISL